MGLFINACFLVIWLLICLPSMKRLQTQLDTDNFFCCLSLPFLFSNSSPLHLCICSKVLCPWRKFIIFFTSEFFLISSSTLWGKLYFLLQSLYCEHSSKQGLIVWMLGVSRHKKSSTQSRMSYTKPTQFDLIFPI